ncbi:MAG: DUF3368 domain-containing protein [Treponema sp.]|nr:DUF3368 domain-containing protein [Treponema sp.]
MPSDINESIIISDTSCLIALTNINLLDILRQLYNKVLITPEVANEYGESLPEWINIKPADDTRKIIAFNRYIDLGESSAIVLAMELNKAVLIIDDKEARQFALNLGLKITGTLGVLIRAYKQGLITDILTVISHLKEAGFRLPDNIHEYLI